jgi:AH receptor-interacting protein
MKQHKHGDDDHEQHHCCGFMALEQGLGHEDLDKLMRNPQPLDFTFGMRIFVKPNRLS